MQRTSRCRSAHVDDGLFSAPSSPGQHTSPGSHNGSVCDQPQHHASPGLHNGSGLEQPPASPLVPIDATDLLDSTFHTQDEASVQRSLVLRQRILSSLFILLVILCVMIAPLSSMFSCSPCNKASRVKFWPWVGDTASKASQVSFLHVPTLSVLPAIAHMSSSMHVAADRLHLALDYEADVNLSDAVSELYQQLWFITGTLSSKDNWSGCV